MSTSSTSSPLATLDTNRQMSNTTTTTTRMDKPSIREWTFPRQLPHAPLPSTSSSPASSDSEHGRSSSLSPALHTSANSISKETPASTSSNSKGAPHSTKSRTKSTAASKDLRHRTNASVFNAQTPATSISLGSVGVAPPTSSTSSLPTKPRDVAKMVYSNVRRRSAQDLAYIVIFGGCLLVFTSALLGMGWEQAQAASGVKEVAGAGSKAEAQVVTGRGEVIDVEIPKGFLLAPKPGAPGKAEPVNAPPPADIHQPHGDSSHDQGEDLLVDSPEDPALDDENAHHHPTAPADALFDDSTPDSLGAHKHDSAQAQPQHVDIEPEEDDEDVDDALEDHELEDTTHVVQEEGQEVDSEGAVEEDDDDIVIEEDDDSDLRMHQAEPDVDVDGEEEGELTIAEDEDDAESVGELLDVEDVPEGEGDASLIPADEPDLNDPDEEEVASGTGPGDEARRPGGREGIEVLKREREAVGQGRKLWEEDVRDSRGPRGRMAGRGRAVRIR